MDPLSKPQTRWQQQREWLGDLGIPADAVSPDAMRRIRIIATTTFAMCVIGTPFVYQFWRLGMPELSIATSVAIIGGVSNLLLLRVTRRPLLCAHLGLIVLTAVLTMSNIATGGFYNPNLSWLYVLPLGAAVMIDSRGAAIWTAIVLAITVCFWSLPDFGIHLQDRIPVELRHAHALLNRLTAIIAIGAIGASFVVSQRRTERQLALANADVLRETSYVHLLIHAAVAANEAASLEEALRSGLERICSSMEWIGGRVFLVSEDGSAVSGKISYASDAGVNRVLAKINKPRRYLPGEGTIGRALATGRPQFIEDLGDDVRANTRAAHQAGVLSTVAVPVIVNGEVKAVLQFASAKKMQHVDRLLEVFELIGVQLGKVGERSALYDRIQQSQKMEAVGQLAAGLAHEINNPMSYVRSNLHTLAEEWGSLRSKVRVVNGETAVFDEFDECQALIEESLEGVERTIAIVRDVQEFSRTGEADQMRWEASDLVDLIERAQRVASTRAPAGIRFRNEVRAGEALCRCSPNQLGQVFVNLIVNAIDAVGDSGTITLSAGRDGDEVFARIEDDGPGIPDEIRERLFDPFFTTKQVGNGTGLGLSISYEIVRSHNGEIRVASEVGGGSVFEVRLPASVS